MKFRLCAIALFLALLMLSSGILLKYDYAGIRTQKTVNGITTNYFNEGSRILGEETNGNMTWYYYDESGVSGMRYQNVDYVFEKNILGDVVGIYRANDRAYMGGYYYDAWGNAYYSGTYTWVVDVNPFRYRGYYWDIQTGLYYLQSRYYDSRTGRFLNADNPENLYYTADLTGGANLYSYCYNNPVMYTDSTGMCFLCDGWNWLKGAAKDVWGVVTDHASEMLMFAGGAVLFFVPGGQTIGLSLMGAAVGSMIGGQITQQLGWGYEVGSVVGSFGGAWAGAAASRLISTGSRMLGGARAIPTKSAPRSISGYKGHGVDSAISHNGRGVSLSAIRNTIQNPKYILTQANGTYRYVGQNAVVVLNKQGQVVTMFL